MPAPSPLQSATAVVNLTITANGAPLDASIQVASIDVWAGVNCLPRARLVILDGNAADENFPISETTALIPGAILTIALGYGAGQTTVFAGVIHRQGLEITANTPSRLVVEATDKAMGMTLARANAVFPNVTDSEVCQSLITQAGLTAKVTPTNTLHEVIVQYYATSWDLLVMRAQLTGMVVTVDNGTVTVAPPNTQQEPTLTLTYGESLLDFRADMDASTQLAVGAITGFAWDSATQALATSGAPHDSVTEPGNLSSATLAQVFNVSPYTLQSAGDLGATELTDWASAERLWTQLAKIRGEARFQGSALLAPGCMVTLAGLGERFNGNAFVSAIHHSVAGGIWSTSAEIGLAPTWFAESTPNVAAPGASGQLPPINNLQAATVAQIDRDPDGEIRVLVTLPLLQSGTGVWARFGSFYASNGIGSCFYPEIGDEVVVAFLGGDPRYPVILGSLYSKAKPPPSPPQATNDIKTLVSRSNMKIEFDESLRQISLTTPAGQHVILNDNDQSITATDANGNSLRMNPRGLSIVSASDIAISATGSITLTAQNALTATGVASAKFASEGMVEIKGATVALNP